MTDIYETIKLVADIAILPLLGMIYSVQGRLSTIEGQLKIMLKLHLKDSDP
jgi:hypothetical protein